MDVKKKRKRIKLQSLLWLFSSLIFFAISIYEWTESDRSLALVITFAIVGIVSMLIFLILFLATDEIINESNKNINKFINQDNHEEIKEDHEKRIRESLKAVVITQRSSYRKKFIISLIGFVTVILILFFYFIDLDIFPFVIIAMFASFPMSYFASYSFGSVEGIVETIIESNKVSKWLD